MCRIHGHLGGDPIDRSTMFAIASAQRHGGPDAQSVHLGPGWALGNARLAVQGIDGGAQPFHLGQYLTCVYNGMIYNHEHLRNQLSGYGHRFESACDGDLLLPLYERYGDTFTTHLEGMYAIAIVDARRGPPELKLFVDHTAMKSLYYYRTADGRGLRFASEIQALRQFPDFPDAVNLTAIDRYFAGKAVWGPETMFTEVKTLPPGYRARFTTSGGLTLAHTAVPPARGPHPDLDVTTTGEHLDQHLRTEMARMLRADAPVCVITSGGLDSSYLTGIAAEIAAEVHTFNVAYTGSWPADERGFAADVAAHCGTRHTQVELDPARFPALTEQFVAHLDQPNNAPHSLSTYGLFQAIRAAGFKAAVTGDGADELFAGYRRFQTATTATDTDWHRHYQATLATAAPSALASLYTPAYRETLNAAGGLFSDQVGHRLAERAGASPDRLEALLRFDQYERFPYYILRRLDHLSMAHGVEARIPFLQPRIVNFAHHLPAHLKIADGIGKAPVASAARSVIPRHIIDRPKQPFTLPIAAMMTPGQPLFDMVGDIALPVQRTAALLDPVAVKSLFAQQASGTAGPDTAALLWSILILEMWLATHRLTL